MARSSQTSRAVRIVSQCASRDDFVESNRALVRDSSLFIPAASCPAPGAVSFRVELASSSFEQARGLMFRTKLGPDEGMLFPMEPPREASP